MASININYLNLPGDYLFLEISRRLQAYAAKNPKRNIIRLGIGDVTQPLVPAVMSALSAAVLEQGNNETFRGYGPEQGYAFLREAIASACYAGLGISAGDVFISDGSKCDIGNFQEILSPKSRVAITDPVYPVYADSNVMAGRAGRMAANGRFKGLIYLPCTVDNDFVPQLPEERPDIIYLCYPNNPTGTVLSREQLSQWVNYAREHEAIILFDAAYESFIRTPGIPHSIYEIDGADEVAVEFRSYSKSAGFTGLRCGFVVVPPKVRARGLRGKIVSLRELWSRRQSTKYNGCPYIVQRAAQAVHGVEGQRQTSAVIASYLHNAGCIRRAFESLGLPAVGGIDAPYVWVRLPEGTNSWQFFDALLERVHIVGTPGVGFGPCGEGYFRLTGFGNAQETQEAVERLELFSL